MELKELKEFMKEIGFKVLEFEEPIFDFFGRYKGFEIYGCFEIENDKISYSLYFTDVSKDIEYGAMIGKISADKESVMELIEPDFFNLN